MRHILAIESSCDETACAVVRDGKEILSNIVSSQINVHTLYGGVVPEVASRIHVENISAVIKEAIDRSGVTMEDIDAIAFTQGPGLIGSLHVGVMAAKTLAWQFDKPLVPVNHMCGHIYANRFVSELTFPLMALVVSGGHTQLVFMEDEWDFKVIGETTDDAIGEAYDKVSRVLGLGYPGGPAIDKIARQGSLRYKLPLPKTHGRFDFSFSGLKTAVLQLIQREERKGEEINVADLAHCFQETALSLLTSRTLDAVGEYKPKMLVLAGGVAANSRLRELLPELMKKYPETKLVLPPMFCCTDNAAMIAAAGEVALRHGVRGSFDCAADPGLLMPGEE